MTRKLLFSKEMSTMASFWRYEIFFSSSDDAGLTLWFKTTGEDEDQQIDTDPKTDINTPEQLRNALDSLMFQHEASEHIDFEAEFIPALFEQMPKFSLVCLRHHEIEYGDRFLDDESLSRFDTLWRLLTSSDYDISTNFQTAKDQFNNLYAAAEGAFISDPENPNLPTQVGKLEITWGLIE